MIYKDVKEIALTQGRHSMDALEMILLYDYYGALLTDRQRMCFELHYNQDLSLGEIAAELHISRQGVYDNLSRGEALLRNMEEKTGCVRRDRRCRKAMETVTQIAEGLRNHPDPDVAASAGQIITAAQELEE